jgi:hypothetical protein
VKEWFTRNDGIACRVEERKDPMYTFAASHFIPASLADYEAYLTSKPLNK